ncbi:ribonuclease PH [Zavarzinella formosa]|uniref:ribonuclease PH n=1 Tax=Zavarzinella formosa TaxID=360055 RepID=UPI000309997E|nr:ribonuclease PH [Zavarzinella formosa]
MRPHQRATNQLRPLTFELGFTKQAAGSVLVRSGVTTVLCTCSLEMAVPPFLVGKGTGWLTAEYGMLPGSTLGRKPRDKAGKVDGRSVEIQRLIGRSLRAVVDLSKLGERTLWLDCDVIEADGGTRTAAINGAFVALAMALHKYRDVVGPANQIVRDSVAAISVGLLENEERLDLEYVEDRDAEVDMNLVMTGSGKFIEVQGAGEEATFTSEQLFRLIDLGKEGIANVTRLQEIALGASWPL